MNQADEMTLLLSQKYAAGAAELFKQIVNFKLTHEQHHVYNRACDQLRRSEQLLKEFRQNQKIS